MNTLLSSPSHMMLMKGQFAIIVIIVISLPFIKDMHNGDSDTQKHEGYTSKHSCCILLLSLK